jgi:hypothetical protein
VARIRALKPEAFQSESLAAVSVEAERTCFGLSTLADDRGRHADKPLTINGALWAERPWHTAEHLLAELEELLGEGILCRYVGCDGRRYIHLVTWDRHQKIERPSKSRLPRCPHHLVSVTGRVEECGTHGTEPCPLTEPSPNPHRTSGEGSIAGLAAVSSPPEAAGIPNDRSAPGSVANEGKPRSERVSGNPHRTLTEPSVPDLRSKTVDRRSRIVDLPPSAGADAPSGGGTPAVHAGTIVGAYCDGAKLAGLDEPSAKLKARVGKDARRLLGEGKNPERLVAAATEMGGTEFNDLDVAYRRADSAAKRSSGGFGRTTSPPTSNGKPGRFAEIQAAATRASDFPVDTP